MSRGSARDNLSARMFDFPSIHDVCGSTTTPKSCRSVTSSIAAPRARCEWKLDMSFASHVSPVSLSPRKCTAMSRPHRRTAMTSPHVAAATSIAFWYCGSLPRLYAAVAPHSSTSSSRVPRFANSRKPMPFGHPSNSITKLGVLVRKESMERPVGAPARRVSSVRNR